MAESWFFEVLPCRPKPYPDECLSGYLLRLAEANGLNQMKALAQDLFPMWSRPAQTALLRWEYPMDTWGRIPLRTQIPAADLKRMTVLPWLEKFRAAPVLARPGYLAPGHFLRGIVAPSLQICPLCLQAQPYIRLLWRLTAVHVCLQHRCLLQTHCHQCGRPLSAIGPDQHYLHCTVCNADLRQLPIAEASQDVLVRQQRRQVDLQFLLDPDTTLINRLGPDSQDLTRELREAIGLRFRYLRTQTGLSAKETSRQLGVTEKTITSLETGKYAPLPFYVVYLEHLSWTWADFAALEVPAEFVHNPYRTKQMPLRICPTPTCPNHLSPASTRVRLIKDEPDRQRARFWCTACDCRFVRSYDGELVIPPESLPAKSEELPPLIKPREEIALLTQLGLQGEGNCQIAQRLGWAPRTVRWYWIALGIEEQVHQAQAQRRQRQKRQQDAIARAHLDAVLQSMIEQDQEITPRKVSLALGYCTDHLGPNSDGREHVHQVAQSHNAQVRQRCEEALETCIMALLEELPQSDHVVTMAEIAQRAGICYHALYINYPELRTRVRQAVQEQEGRIKAQQKERLRIQIDEAAARLIKEGKRLSSKAIAREAGLNERNIYSKPVVLGLLQRWVGGLA
jgi:transcriptional regulator with XRE-family HTH domain